MRRSRSSLTGSDLDLVGSSGSCSSGGLRVAVVAGRLAPEPVDGPVAGGGDDPAARVRRHARRRATARRRRRTRPGPPPRRCRCRRRGGPGWPPPGRTPRRKTCSTVRGSRRRSRGRLLRARPGTAAPRPGPGRRPWPWRPTPARRRGRRASITQKPPSCSLVSANGPSVVTTSPFCDLHDGGGVGGCRPPANTQAPAGLELVVDGVDVGVHLLRSRRRGRHRVAFDHVHGQQVLGHVALLGRGDGTVPSLTRLRTGTAPNRQPPRNSSQGQREARSAASQPARTSSAPSASPRSRPSHCPCRRSR